MSYDLNFWKYSVGVTVDHQAVYEKLSDGEVVEGIEEIPISEFINRVVAEFGKRGWQRLNEHTWDSKNGSFQLYTTPQFFRVDCYGMSGDDMNIFIDIGSEFSCPLYDPQVGKRYEG